MVTERQGDDGLGTTIIETERRVRGVVHAFKNVGQEPARCLGIVTPGGLAEKLLTGLGEQAKAETLPPPPEGPPDVEWIAQIVSKYDTKWCCLRDGRLDRRVTTLLSGKGSRGLRSGPLASKLISQA